MEDEKIVLEQMLIPCGVPNSNHDIYSKEAIEDACERFKMRSNSNYIFRSYGDDAADLDKVIGKVLEMITDDKGNAIVKFELDPNLTNDIKFKEDVKRLVEVCRDNRDGFQIVPKVMVNPEDVTKDEDGHDVLHKAQVVSYAFVPDFRWSWQKNTGISMGSRCVKDDVGD